MDMLILEQFTDDDIILMEKWINKEYVKKWYGNLSEWIYEIKERNGKYNFIKHFIVKHTNIKIGFCQYYDCFDAKEDWYKIDKQNNTYSIDYLIGEENYLNKGYGKEIIKQLIGKIKKINGKEIVVKPELENISSIKILLGNGFIYDKEKEYYYKIL